MIFAPPELPNIPKIQPELADYLRRLSAWADKQMQYKIATDIAIGGILILTPSKQKVYRISVDDSGVITSTLVPLGSHP
jgi:hypothetical protein